MNDISDTFYINFSYTVQYVSLLTKFNIPSTSEAQRCWILPILILKYNLFHENISKGITSTGLYVMIKYYLCSNIILDEIQMNVINGIWSLSVPTSIWWDIKNMEIPVIRAKYITIIIMHFFESWRHDQNHCHFILDDNNCVKNK